MNALRPARADRLFQHLLRLFPAGFRARFETDLLDLFRDTHRAAVARGGLAHIAFWFRIVVDVLTSALAERLVRTQSPHNTHDRGALMQGLRQDIWYAVRLMARRPAISLVIIATLALGIGATTAIFSLVHTVILRPLPYPDAGRLVMVWEAQMDRADDGIPVRPANFIEWKARATSFEDIAWSRDAMYNITGEGEPESVLGYRFSPNMFQVLGVEPALGRVFRPEEDQPGAPKVAVLSHTLWQRRYGGDREILGRSVTLNGESHTVIGVMPATFTHPQGVEIWTPVALTPALAANRSQRLLRLVGRLKPGVAREDAQAELASLYQDLAREYPDVNTGTTAHVVQFGDSGDAKPLLAILFVGVGFVLLIACANVANLLLADATSRRRELAVRSALGASGCRVARQLLTESVMLALAGGLLGALLTWWASDALVMIFPSNIANLDLPLVEQIDIGAAVMLFALVTSVVTGVLFGLLPAWNAARGNLQGALKDGERGGSSARRTHAALVVVEVALSVVLLAGALLMVQSFMRLQQQQLGFEPDRVLSARLMLPQYRYPDQARIVGFTRALIERLQAVPGVESVGVTNYLPLSGWWGSTFFEVEGRPRPAPGAEPTADSRNATEEYFRSMGIRLLAGRTFTERDNASAPAVVIVNETLAKRYWPGEDPIGRRIVMRSRGERIAYEVVGVVADVKSFGLEEETHAELFRPYWQEPSPLLGVTLRAGVDPAALAAPLRAAVWSVDPEQPITHLLRMSELASESLAFRRAGMLLAGGFGLLAVVLAAIGIYGVLSYSITRRTREIGVRVALGATGREVTALVMRQGLLMTGLGIAVGLAAALPLMGFLGSVLFEVRPGDPTAYAAGTAILIAVALLATWLPARRATTIDPVVALRAE